MRHGSNSRRSRGRNGGSNNNNNQRRSGNPKMQTFDSNGPDVRIRGNALQITEKYTALARDAASAGDTILAESYYQHAEHYQRLINEFTEMTERADPRNDDGREQEISSDNNAPARQPSPSRAKRGASADSAEQAEEETQNSQAAPARRRAVRPKKPLTVDA